MTVVFVTFCLFIAVNTSDIPKLQVMTVKHGDNITIKCDHNMSVENKYMHFFWYKQDFGMFPESVVKSFQYNKIVRFEPAFNNGRFSISVDGLFDLSINNIKDDDIGTYLCGEVSTSFPKFIAGSVLMIEDEKNVQSPLTKIVTKRGESTTLQCSVQVETPSCVGKYSVYWNKHGSGKSPPGVIYSHGDSSDQCKKSFDTDSPTHICVLDLPKGNLSLPHAGTYYCAVATCGNITFGKGTTVEEDNHMIVIGLAISNIIAFVIIVVLFGALFKSQRKGASNYNPSQTSQAEDSNPLTYTAVRFIQKPSSSTMPRVKDSQDLYAQIKPS